MHLGDFDNYFKNLNKSVFWHMDEILHVKLGISTKFYLWDIILSHTFKYIYWFTCTSITTHWGSASANYHLFCCIVQTDLSAELALRPQYQYCFHKITKSPNYSITLYIKTVLILSTQECSTNVNYLVVQCIEWKRLAWELDMNMVKVSCDCLHLKLLSLTCWIKLIRWFLKMAKHSLLM